MSERPITTTPFHKVCGAFRREQEALGRPVAEIAVAMQDRFPGLRARAAWRYASGLTQDVVAENLNYALGKGAEQSITKKRISEYEVWPRGGVQPPLQVLMHLANIYGADNASLLVDDDDRVRMNPGVLTLIAELVAPTSEVITHVRLEGQAPVSADVVSLVSPPDVVHRVAYAEAADARTIIRMAAEVSLRHAEASEATTNLGPLTLDDLDGEVRRLTREHLYANSVTLLLETIGVRNRVYELLEGRQYPRDTDHLYLLAAILCALLADTSSGIGASQHAIMQARSARKYANIVGHRSLCFWAQGRMEASTEHMRGRTDRALTLLQRSAQWVEAPIERVMMHNAEAQYLAYLGRHTDAEEALAAASAARDAVNERHDLCDDVGGMFSYPVAKQSQIAAITYLALERPEKAAEKATEAIDLYASYPVHERPGGNEAAARIDLARSRLKQGELGEARQVLAPVFALAPERRLRWFGLRLEELRIELGASVGGGSTTARALDEEIGVYSSIDARVALPEGLELE